MKDIYILTDYKGYFGSKQKTEWYKSGMDLSKIQSLLAANGYNPVIRCFSDINLREEDYRGKIVIYTSSEDPGYYYKDYIEDIIYALHLQGANLIPRFEFLRANNNKVFMELLRDLMPIPFIKNIQSNHFGTLEKLMERANTLAYPVVIKSARGAMSKGVFLAKNETELIHYAKKVSKTPNLFSQLWELKNYLKLSGKIRLSSWNRKKFVVQNFVDGLSNDWKVLVFGDKYYALNRLNRKNDFRASGSGIFKFRDDVPDSLLDFAQLVFQQFKLPNVSLDIAYDGKELFLMEFQAIYFGTKTIENSPFYFTKSSGRWELITEEPDLEREYVQSVIQYLMQQSELQVIYPQ